MPDAKETLQQWAKEDKLKEAKLSDDGSALSLGDTTLNAKDMIEISCPDGKNVEYSVASIFLQILDPNIGLVKYRNDCKKHKVNDAVKAKDKPVVVNHFVPSSSSQEEAEGSAAAAPEAADPSEAAPAKPAAETEKANQESKQQQPRPPSSSISKERHDKKRSSSSHQKDKHDKKKRRSLVSNEQIFSDLNVVVDKRAPGDETGKETSEAVSEEPKSEATEAIRKALSTEGFEVTPEILDKYRDKTEKEIIAHEIPVGNSASVLRAASVEANLTRVLNLFLETVNPKGSGGGSSGHKKGVVAPTVKKTMRPYLVGKKPIILLPKGMTAPITMLNAYDFFANARFIPRDIMMKNKALQANSKTTTFTRKMPNVGLVEFELVDNPRKLQTKEDWERVVAVLVLGHAWQFKDWPGKYSNPVDLFAKTFGFYIGMEGDKLPSDLEGWACQRGYVHRDKRGLDSVTYASFWNSLDDWIKINRPELLPQPE